MVYHHYEVSSEVNPLYSLQYILLLRFYLVPIAKQNQNQTSFTTKNYAISGVLTLMYFLTRH